MSILRSALTRNSKVLIESCLKKCNRTRWNEYGTSIAGVVKSPYGDVEVPNQNVADFVWSRSSEWEDLPAVTCGVSGRSYTYGMARMLCRRGAGALLGKLGLKPGDRIGLLLPNIPEYLVAIHAGMEAGLTVTFANPLYTAEEISRQFKSAEVRCIVTIPLLLETALRVATTLPNYTQTINVGGDMEPARSVLGMQALLMEDHEVDLPEVKSSDVAVLPYSSGTTGLPKGVMLTHRNLVANLVQCSHPEIGEITAPSSEFQETVLSVLPFFHIYGLNGILNMVIHHGGHIITIPKFTPEDYLSCLVEHRPTVLFLVPSLLLFLASHPGIKPEHLASVKQVICGAAPAPKNLLDKFKQKLARDDCTINQGYGMTESSPVTLFTPRSMPNSKAGSCGRPVPSTLARLVKLDDGKDVTAAHETGELLVKGPQVMKGYLNNPRATAETIDDEGWLHTGDVAYYDEDGYFFIVDRTKELIKVKGNQVSPTELEAIILEIPGVTDVAVVGVPDTLAGELPRAFVVKNPSVDLTEERIASYVEPKVVAYKRLAGGVTFVNAIPRNPAGKIMRNELKVFGK